MAPPPPRTTRWATTSETPRVCAAAGAGARPRGQEAQAKRAQNRLNAQTTNASSRSLDT